MEFIWGLFYKIVRSSLDANLAEIDGMRDFNFTLAIAGIVLLAYQAEIDDRPPVHQEPWTHPRETDWTVFLFTAALVLVVAMIVLMG